MDETLVGHLSRLGTPALAALLRQRPEVLDGPEPPDLDVLAERLVYPGALVEVLSTAPLPYLQAAEALAALGSRVTVERFAALLAPAGGAAEHRRDVETILRELVDRAVVWPGADGIVVVPPNLGSIFGRPLGLEPPLREQLVGVTVDQLRRIQKAVGLKQGTRRDDLLASLVQHLGQPEVVRALVATAPAEVRTELERQARTDTDADDDLLYDRNHYKVLQAAASWAGERGLLIGSQWSYSWSMPAEVALALRGPDFRAPFEPRQPELPTSQVEPSRVESESTAAATAFANDALTVLDHVARRPLKTIKSGAVGVRELSRVAKATGSEQTVIRLVLELGAATGLLDRPSDDIEVSEKFEQWRTLEPGLRFTVLVTAWWELPFMATDDRDEDGKTLSVLAGRSPCPGCVMARTQLLRVASGRGVDEGAVPAAYAESIGWVSPLAHLATDADRPLSPVWHEAELLGLMASGAASRLGRLLVEGDEPALAEHASYLLPHSSDQATFGADLTAMVVGAPSSHVSALLDSAADRESRGGAIMWRISPTSIRRALDAGATAEGLEESLSAIATGDLPQPLRYLIADVGRRHGLLRLAPAVSMIRSEDTALLAEVCADRKLKKLGLQPIAPTVLGCAVPMDEALTALRAAGYFPMPDGPTAGADTPVTESMTAGTTTSDAAPAQSWRSEEEELAQFAEELQSLLGDDFLQGGILQGDGAVHPPLDPDEVAQRLSGGRYTDT